MSRSRGFLGLLHHTYMRTHPRKATRNVCRIHQECMQDTPGFMQGTPGMYAGYTRLSGALALFDKPPPFSFPGTLFEVDISTSVLIDLSLNGIQTRTVAPPQSSRQQPPATSGADILQQGITALLLHVFTPKASLGGTWAAI